jgi:hypothetical protein
VSLLWLGNGDPVFALLDSQVDRIYLNTPNELQIVDRGNRTIAIKKTGLPDASEPLFPVAFYSRRSLSDQVLDCASVDCRSLFEVSEP